MLQDWAFAQKGQGVTVHTVRGDVIVLEFNEFLGRIASGLIGPDDTIVSQVMTDGKQRRVGDLKLYAQVVSGQFQTQDLPRRVPGGVLAIESLNGMSVPPMQSTMYPAIYPNMPFHAPPALQTVVPPTRTHVTTPPSPVLLNAGLITAWLLALIGFSLFCAFRPGTAGTHPTSSVQFRPVTHPEHPPFLPR